MLLKLKKKKLKNLSLDIKALPTDMTPNVAGGAKPTLGISTLSECAKTISQASCIRSCGTK